MDRFYGSTPSGGANLEGVIYHLTIPGIARLYCPNAFVRRDQMAVFLLKIAHGPDYTPPPCSGQFGDVACPGLFADWIEQLAAEGITAGCAGGNYCPLSPVTRGQMAVFLLKIEARRRHTRLRPVRGFSTTCRAPIPSPRGSSSSRPRGSPGAAAATTTARGCRHPRPDGGLPSEARARRQLRSAGLRAHLYRRRLPFPSCRLDRELVRGAHHGWLRRRLTAMNAPTETTSPPSGKRSILNERDA